MAHEILTNEQMAEADRHTIESGVSGYDLMCRAGQAVVDVVLERFSKGKILILCGPGNNGGDGFVIARLLKEQGWNITLASLANQEQLKGNAAKAASDWDGDILPFEGLSFDDEKLVIDSVFGTGFSKKLMPPVSDIFDLIKTQGSPVLAVDIASGVNGSTGLADPHTLRASVTVTFHRKKLGHVLSPGLGYAGEVLIKDIGIMDDFEFTAQENHPDLWGDKIPRRERGDHKYKHGHAVIYGAPELTGATRLAAESSARIGAGLVTVLALENVATIYRETLEAHILVRDDLDWDDERVTAKLYGSGGMSAQPDFNSKIPTVLDADALQNLPDTLGNNFILTPHEGEFARAFPEIEGSKMEKAQCAADKTGAIIVLKGPDTVIAAPGKVAIINTHSSPDLATAGTGDVLAGMITGLIAQGMRPFDASCAAVWIHGECALRYGAGLVASDLPDMIPQILKDFA